MVERFFGGGRKLLFSFFLTRSNSVPLPATPAPAGTPVLSWSMSEERRSSSPPSPRWRGGEEVEAVVEKEEAEVVGDEEEVEFGVESKMGTSARRRSRGLLRRSSAEKTVVAIDSTIEMAVNVVLEATSSGNARKGAAKSEFPIAASFLLHFFSKKVFTKL